MQRSIQGGLERWAETTAYRGHDVTVQATRHSDGTFSYRASGTECGRFAFWHSRSNAEDARPTAADALDAARRMAQEAIDQRLQGCS